MCFAQECGANLGNNLSGFFAYWPSAYGACLAIDCALPISTAIASKLDHLSDVLFVSATSVRKIKERPWVRG